MITDKKTMIVETPADWVAIHARSTPDQVAIVDGESRISYAELDKFVTQISNNLQVANVNVGDAVATLLPNSWEMVAVLLATFRCGAVALPMNSHYRESEIEHIIRSSRPKALFASVTHIPIVEKIVGNVGGDNLVRVGVPKADAPWLSFDDYLREPEQIRPLQDTDGSVPILWLYSSGSTGGAKKISRSRRQLFAESVAFNATVATRADDIFLCSVPLSHAYGMCVGLFAAMYAGATLVLHKQFDRRQFLATVETERVTIVPASPFMMQILAETKMAHEPDLSSIRLCLTGGAPLARQTFDAFQDRYQLSIRQAFGSTETGLVTINLAKDTDATWSSVGAPLQGYDVAAFDAEGRLQPPGREGAIGIKSPSMFDGYDNEELNQTAIKGGRFFPGDRGKVDAEGRVYITGRDTLFINIAGNKVDPAELELLIGAHPKVTECVVLGITQRGTEEIVKAVVVAKEACEPSEIVEFCRGKIADYKLPRIIEFRDEIPRNPLGKVLRKYLQ